MMLDATAIEIIVLHAEHIRRVARKPAADPMWGPLRARLAGYREAMAGSCDPDLIVLRQRIVALIGEARRRDGESQEI